jgi:hypothetical protein
VPIELKLSKIARDRRKLIEHRDLMVHAARWCTDDRARRDAKTKRDRLSVEIASLEALMGEAFGIAALTPQQKYDEGNDRRGAILAQRARKREALPCRQS